MPSWMFLRFANRPLMSGLMHENGSGACNIENVIDAAEMVLYRTSEQGSLATCDPG